MEIDHTLDARGLMCPEPVMLLHRHIGDVPVGGVLEVLATDPSTRRDVPKFCAFLGHELLSETEEEGVLIYRLRRLS